MIFPYQSNYIRKKKKGNVCIIRCVCFLIQPILVKPLPTNPVEIICKLEADSLISNRAFVIATTNNYLLGPTIVYVYLTHIVNYEREIMRASMLYIIYNQSLKFNCFYLIVFIINWCYFFIMLYFS